MCVVWQAFCLTISKRSARRTEHVMPDEKKTHAKDLNVLESSDKRVVDEEKRIRANELLWFLEFASPKQLSNF